MVCNSHLSCLLLAHSDPLHEEVVLDPGYWLVHTTVETAYLATPPASLASFSSPAVREARQGASWPDTTLRDLARGRG